MFGTDQSYLYKFKQISGTTCLRGVDLKVCIITHLFLVLFENTHQALSSFIWEAIVLFENVTGILAKKNEKTLDSIFKSFEKQLEIT